jgi:hypothetical protein
MRCGVGCVGVRGLNDGMSDERYKPARFVSIAVALVCMHLIKHPMGNLPEWATLLVQFAVGLSAYYGTEFVVRRLWSPKKP